MLPNNDPDPRVRLERLLDAIRRVYASTFSRHAQGLPAGHALPARGGEDGGHPAEGRRRAPRRALLPRLLRRGPLASTSIPRSPLTSEDGVAAVALGLGRSVVEGEKCLTFCPRYPRHLLQFSSVKDIVKNSQRQFWALELDPAASGDPERELRRERASTSRWPRPTARSSRSAPPTRTRTTRSTTACRGPACAWSRFAPVLKHGVFPLAEILEAAARHRPDAA